MNHLKNTVLALNIMFFLFLMGSFSFTYSEPEAKANDRLKQSDQNRDDGKISIIRKKLDGSLLGKIDFSKETGRISNTEIPEPPSPPTTDGWQTIKSETFEGSFPNDWQLLGTGWGKSNYRKNNGTYSGWCAQGTNPGGHTYTYNMNTWMIYGPFDLSDPNITNAKLSFWHWTISEYQYDYFMVGVSRTSYNSGYSVYGYTGNFTTLSGNVNGWNFLEFDLNDWDGEGDSYLDDNQVWIAFGFGSDNVVNYEGSYVDDISITKEASDPFTLTSPNGGETWYTGSNQNITWNSTGNSGNIKIEYTTNGTSWTTIVASTPDDGSHPWTVPDTPSTTCKVKITDSDGTPTDQSNNNFTIKAPFITVASPNGGESWESGTNHNITWTSGGTSGNVKIEFTTDGSNWISIIESTPDDGAHSWAIPESPSTNCRVRVTDVDGNPTDTSNNSFTITAPNIIITSPNGGESWLPDSSHPITWTSYRTSGNLNIDLSTNNGVSWTRILSNVTDDGSKSWTVSNTPSSQCLIAITDADGAPSDTSDNVFTIQGDNITITSPNGGESWEVGSAHNITWTTLGTIPNVKIEYSINNGTNWNTINANTPNNNTLSWTIPDNQSTNCLIRVADIDGTPTDQSDNVFTITTPPCPPHFAFTVTEDYYPILLYTVTLDDIPANTCDEVGVFASDGQGGLVCAGAVTINGAPPYSLQAWSDDSQTGVKDGFSSGEALHYRFWDSETQTEYGPEFNATYTTGNGNWGNGAMAEINPLQFKAGCNLTINLLAGWNWISSNVAPDSPDMETVWAGIPGLNIVKGQSGFYIPGVINTIGDWDVKKMYMVNVQSACQLVITGSCIAADMPIPLQQNWNWVGYLPNSPINAETALASIVSHLSIAKSRNGFYIPGTINNIGNMTTGSGYRIYLDQAATLIYPAATASPEQNLAPELHKTAPQRQHFATRPQSDDYHAIVIENVQGLQPGAEIAIYSENGLYAGSVVYTGQTPIALLAWADNDETDLVEGLKSGEKMYFKYWNEQNNNAVEMNCLVNKGSEFFGASPYSFVTLETVESLPTRFSLQQNYPNPFNPTTTIQYELPVASRVELAIYNINGELIKLLTNELHEAGRYTAIWDGTNQDNTPVSSGIYFYQLDTQKEKFIKKLTLVK
ncbi:MAG TPA: FlgD immunoglobulin-like domain containing protein [bacterium]|nr:FlgD immunoglobulin-like domain containing protein [bacterium]HPN46097.1 FlgD immunoglobulin-like domain containing protein [bacterium]